MRILLLCCLLPVRLYLVTTCTLRSHTSSRSSDCSSFRPVDVPQGSRAAPLDPQGTARDYGFTLAGDGGCFGTGAGLEVDEGAAGAVDANDGFDWAEGGEEGADVMFCEVVFNSAYS